MSKSNELVSILTAGCVGMRLTLSGTDPPASSGVFESTYFVRVDRSESRKSLLNIWCHSHELCELSLALIRTHNERFSVDMQGGRHTNLTLEHSTPFLKI